MERNSSFTPRPIAMSKLLVTYNLSGQEPLNAPDMGARDLPWYLHPQWQAMPPIEPWLMTSIGVLMTLVGVTGAAGNFTVLFLLFRCKKLQSSANMYVLNLAAADILMCLGNFPLLILSSFSGRWVTNYAGCKIYGFIGGLTGFVSINTLTAMACDRYNLVYHSQGIVKPESRRYSLGLMVSLWIYSVFWAIPPFFGWGRIVLDGGQISCCFDYLTRSASDISYIVAIFVFCFGIQVIVIFFCYGSIIAAIYHHEQNSRRADTDILMYQNHCRQHDLLHHHQQQQQHHHQHDPMIDEGLDTIDVEQVLHIAGKTKDRSQRRRRVEVRVTWVVVLITLSFCMSWTPFAVVALMGTFGDASRITPLVSVLPGILAKIATVINPVLYAMGHPHYRSVISKQCCRSHPRRRSRTERRGRGSIALQTGGGMLSSVYFASVLKGSDKANTTEIETAVKMKNALGSSSLV